MVWWGGRMRGRPTRDRQLEAHADQPKTYASSLSTDQGKESAHISQGRASGLGEPRAGQRPQRPAHDTVAGNVPAHSPEQRSGGAGRHSHAQGVVWCTTVFGAAALIVGPAPRRIPKRQPTVRAAARADPSTEGDKKLETIQWIALDTRPRGRSRSPCQKQAYRRFAAVQSAPRITPTQQVAAHSPRALQMYLTQH